MLSLTDIIKKSILGLSAAAYLSGCGGSGNSRDEGTEKDAGNDAANDSGVVCTPVAEACNSVDDDCDGLVDEEVNDCQKIVFSTYIRDTVGSDSAARIEVMNIDGSNRKPLTEYYSGLVDHTQLIDPRWVLRGQQVVFSYRAEFNNNFNLFTVKADGGEIINLTEKSGFIVGGSTDISPDSKKVAYTRFDGDTMNGGVYEMDLESGIETRLIGQADQIAEGACYAPNFGPDNSTLVYLCAMVDNPGLSIVSVFKLVNGVETRITGDSTGSYTNPVITPDGNHFNAISMDSLEERDMNGFNQVPLATTSMPGGFSYDFEQPGRVLISDRVCTLDAALREFCMSAPIGDASGYGWGGVPVASQKDGTIAVSTGNNIYTVLSGPSGPSTLPGATKLTNNMASVESRYPDWSPSPL